MGLKRCPKYYYWIVTKYKKESRYDAGHIGEIYAKG